MLYPVTVRLAHLRRLPLLDAQTPQPAAAFAERHASIAQVVKNSRIVFICVKPQYVKVVLEEVRELLTDDHVIVSIAAGVPIAALKVLRMQYCGCTCTSPCIHRLHYDFCSGGITRYP